MLITILAHDKNIHETASIIDYRVAIKVNGETVWEGEVGGHHRANGWQRLLEKVALAGRKTKTKSRKRGR